MKINTLMYNYLYTFNINIYVYCFLKQSKGTKKVLTGSESKKSKKTVFDVCEYEMYIHYINKI